MPKATLKIEYVPEVMDGYFRLYKKTLFGWEYITLSSDLNTLENTIQKILINKTRYYNSDGDRIK